MSRSIPWLLVLVVPLLVAADADRRLDCPRGTRLDRGRYESACERRVDGEWVREGPFRRWTASGQLVDQGTFHGGVKQGAWTHWYDDGVLNREGSFVGGREVGVHRSYHRNGQLRGQHEYDAQGRLHGSSKVWYEDGSPNFVATYSHGVRVGRYQQWMPNGLVAYDQDLGDGVPGVLAEPQVLDGPAPGETRRPDCPKGTRLVRSRDNAVCGKRVDGKLVLHGPAVRWSRDGNRPLREIGRYHEGDKDGHWRSWHPNRQLESEGTWSRGTRVGLHRQWDQKGFPRWFRTYDSEGRLHGEERWWHEGSGRRLSVATYLHGQHVGTWKKWKWDGRMDEQLLLHEEFDCVGRLIALPVDGHRHGLTADAHALHPFPEVTCPDPSGLIGVPP